MSQQVKKWRGMCVVGVYTPEEILAQIGDHDATFYAGDFPYSVHMDSLRYITFAKSLACCECGLRGTVMRLEYSYHERGHFRPHFNLYALNTNGTYVLMTKDHIVPRSKGGTDTEDNLQTMCSPCNAKKADKYVEAGTENKPVRGNDNRPKERKVRPKVVLDNFHCHCSPFGYRQPSTAGERGAIADYGVPH